MAQPTAHEQYFLELVNRARANPGAEAARLGLGLNDGLAAGAIAADVLNRMLEFGRPEYVRIA